MTATSHESVVVSSSKRLTSLDACRGLVMFLMMAEVLESWRVAQALPGNAFWQFVARQQSHVEWIGCSLHDLIQPSFSFLVGVALPFSLTSRMARGQTRMQMPVRAPCNFPVYGLPAHGQICRMRRVLTRSRLASLNNFFD